jgi:hypothetical protein
VIRTGLSNRGAFTLLLDGPLLSSLFIFTGLVKTVFVPISGGAEQPSSIFFHPWLISPLQP